jgi:hypothetical protein
MNNRGHFLGKPVAIACVFLASIVLVACEQSKQAAPTPAARASSAATTEKVFVTFEGPWAIVADPNDANSVLALAPKTKLHRDLYVAASNDSTLAAGTYDLSVPAHGAAASGALDPSFAQAKIDAKSLQRALDNKSGRYVIRLPKPEAYVAAKRFRSRVGPSYPPDASTEQNYAAFVSFRYTVGTLNGFSLAGTPDAGTFNPLLLQLDTPTIRFAIEPAQLDDPTDMCHAHSREAFRDTVKFLGLTLYVDFPNDSAACHKADPQIPRSTKAEAGRGSPLDPLAALFFQESAGAQTAHVVSEEITPGRSEVLATIDGADPMAHYLTVATVYLFHSTGAACMAPILFLTTTP